MWGIDLSDPEMIYSMPQMISFSKIRALSCIANNMNSIYLLEHYAATWVFLSVMDFVQSKVFGIILVECCGHFGI